MASRFWVGGASTWDATVGTKWATTSGGTGGASVPTATDDAIFDANSGSVAVSPVDPDANCFNLTCTGFTGSFAGNDNLNVSGSVILGAGMTNTNTTMTLLGASIHTFTTNGITYKNTLIFNGSGSYTLQDNLSNTSNITHSLGTLNGNNFNVTCSSISAAGSTSSRTLNMGNGTWTFNSTSSNPFSLGNVGITLNASTSTILVVGSRTTIGQFGGPNTTYNNVSINSTGVSGSSGVTILGSSTFNTLTIAQNQTIKFTAGTTQTIGTLVSNGTLGNLVILASTSAGTAWNISKSSGVVSIDFVSLQDSTATGGATWYAGTHSTNVSNNINWNFTAPPSPSTITGITSITGISTVQF